MEVVLNQRTLNFYVTEKYSDVILKQELSDLKNIYHIIYHDNRAAGYSKIIIGLSVPG